MSFPAEITTGEDGLRASTECTIDRFEFGIKYAGMADDLIRDNVLLKIDLVTP